MTPQEIYQDQIRLKTRAETIANRESENVINTIMNKEEPPEVLQQAPSRETLKEATTSALEGFIQAEAVLVHDQLPTAGHSIETNEKPPDASQPIKTRGNYLDSQRRMRANLLSLGADCTIGSSIPFHGRKTIVVSLPPHEVYPDQTRLKGKQEGNEANFFAMAGKVEEPKPFDLSKAFVYNDKMSFATNLAPVPPSEFTKLLQDVSIGKDHRKLQLDHSYHHNEALFYVEVFRARAKEKGEQSDDKFLKETQPAQVMSIPEQPGFHTSFKIIFNGFKLMIEKYGPVVDFLLTNLEFSFCLDGIKPTNHESCREKTFELKNRNATKAFARNGVFVFDHFCDTKQGYGEHKEGIQIRHQQPRRVPTDHEQAIRHGWKQEIIIRARDKELELAKVSIFVIKNIFKPDYTDIIRLSLSKEPNTGFRADLKLHDNNALIQEEPPDPTSFPFTVKTTNTKHAEDLMQVSISSSRFVSRDLRAVSMSLLYPETIDKKLGLFKGYSELNSCLRMQVKEELDKDTVLNQAEICLFVYSTSMTVIIHLLFARGVDNIAGTKEEPPDLEVTSSNFFVRTRVGVVLTKELKNFKIFLLMEMLGVLHQVLKGRHHEAESLLRIPDTTLSLSFHYRDKSFLFYPFDVSNLVLFVAGQTDLRTNPFQLGEHDTILGGSKDLEHGAWMTQKAMDIQGADGAWKTAFGIKMWLRTKQSYLIIRVLSQPAMTQGDHSSNGCCVKATLVKIQAREG